MRKKERRMLEREWRKPSKGEMRRMSVVEAKVRVLTVQHMYCSEHIPELLIDVTSHEIRQPVSAILNCSALVRSNIISLRQQLWEHSSRSTPFIPNQELIKVMDEDLEALDAIYQVGTFHFYH